MEKHHKSRFPQFLRYPFFLIGLIVIIGGGFAALQLNNIPIVLDIAIAAVGFVFLILAIAIP